jgi:hypothetical protein
MLPLTLSQALAAFVRLIVRYQRRDLITGTGDSERPSPPIAYRHGLVHNHRRNRRSPVSIRNRTLATQISLTPPVVDDGDDDHRADNYNQQPRKFGVEDAQA